MRVPFPNAFTYNKLGFFRAFPFGVAVREVRPGIAAMDLFPQRLRDIGDLITDHVQQWVLVFDVDLYDDQRLGLHFRERGLTYVEHERTAVAIQREGVQTLLETLEHFNFHCVDLPEPGNDEVVRGVLRNYEDSRRAKVARNSFLELSPSSKVYVDSHDDCYLLVETKDIRLQQKLFARALQICFGVLLKKNKLDPVVSDVPQSLAGSLCTVNSALTLLWSKARYDGIQIQVDFSREEYSFRTKKKYPVHGSVCYMPSSGTWRVQ
jgi:hypothetical protein